jgi:hypothetical protein
VTEAQAENRKKFGCPICLPADARIATPSGEIEIGKITAGTIVWGVDESGRRIATRVRARTEAVPPPDHRIVIVELADGRVARGSPGHPDLEGRALGTLAPGDMLNGSRITKVERVPYGGHTFDLVLEGGLSRYVADGVVLESTVPIVDASRAEER